IYYDHVRLFSALPDSLSHKIGHSLCISGSAPVHNCNLAHLILHFCCTFCSTFDFLLQPAACIVSCQQQFFHSLTASDTSRPCPVSSARPLRALSYSWKVRFASSALAYTFQ